MIKTLIIDDNKIIREYFQTMIDWEARGFSLCAVANNGIMGWQEFSRHRPERRDHGRSDAWNVRT